MDFNKPEFDSEGRMLVSFCGIKNGCGVNDYLFFENNQFKVLSCDCYFTGDHFKKIVRVKEFDPIILLKKLIEIGAITKEEIGL